MASEIGNKRFHTLLGVDVRPHTKEVEGMAYIPWARAHGMAGRPAHDVLTFKVNGAEEPVRRIFGGTAVAVSMEVADGRKQVNYLPVLNAKGKPIPSGEETSRDVGDAIGRCIARSIAIVHGLGLSLYSLCEGDGVSYVDALCVTPATPDIAAIEPLRDTKGKKDKDGRPVGRQTEYLGWHAAVAACRITDPEFCWEVLEFEQRDGSLLPATKLGGEGWMVAVKLRYKGVEHVQWLPIMGVKMVKTSNGDKPMDHQPITDPNVMQWHQAVMRCLTKGIAIATGYGIALYAKGDVEEMGLGEADGDEAETQESRAASGSERQATQQQRAPAPAPAPASDAGGDEAVRLRKQVRELLVKTDSDETLFLGWLGVSELDKAGVEKLQRGVQTLTTKLQGQQRARSTN